MYFIGPNTGRTSIKTFTPANPVQGILTNPISPRNPGRILQSRERTPTEIETVDEQFSYYDDNESAPKWGTTEEITEDVFTGTASKSSISCLGQ